MQGRHGPPLLRLPFYKLLKACPDCRGDLLSPPCRLLLLEGMAKDLLVPCPYADDGCPLNALRYADAGAHADKCDWRKVICGEAERRLPPSHVPCSRYDARFSACLAFTA